jgi:hypothetical protein
MTTQTPAAPGQPRDNPASAVLASPSATDAQRARTSRLGRAAWWCLAAFPPVFLVVWFVGKVVFQDGRWVSDGSVWETAILVLMYAALVAAPLASLVLSSIAFRRTRSWRDLAPALTLLVLVTGFLTLGHVQTAITASQPGSGVDPNQSLWDFALPVGIAAWIGAVLVWPHKKS